MLLPVMIRQLQALRTELLLHQRVDHNLLPDRVPRDLPRELAGPPLLSVDIALVARFRVERVIFVHLIVVLFYRGRERLHRTSEREAEVGGGA